MAGGPVHCLYTSPSSVFIVDPQSCHNPEDEDKDGLQNVGLFTVQPCDKADNMKELHYNHLLGKHQIVQNLSYIHK